MRVSNTVHTCESLLHHAVTLRQNAQSPYAVVQGSLNVWSNKTHNLRLNVRYSRSHETIVAVEKQRLLHIPSLCL